MLISGSIPPYYTPPEIMNDTRGLYVNLETLELSYYMKKRMENNPFWQNITDVFKGKVSAFDLQAKFAEVGKTMEMSELKKLNDNINAITRIKDREFLIKEYPTGTMLLWETATPPELKGPHKYDTKQESISCLASSRFHRYSR